MTPTPPQDLSTHGLQLWNRVWEAGADWLDKRIDFASVHQLCQLADERETLQQLVRDNPEDWRTRAGLRSLDRMFERLSSQLGLTPRGRALINNATIPEPQGKLAELRKRRDERRAEAKRNQAS